MLQSSDKQSWTSLDAAAFIHNDTAPQYLSFGVSGNNAPKEVKVLSFNLQITPSLNSELKDIVDIAKLDGNANISFEYH